MQFIESGLANERRVAQQTVLRRLQEMATADRREMDRAAHLMDLIEDAAGYDPDRCEIPVQLVLRDHDYWRLALLHERLQERYELYRLCREFVEWYAAKKVMA